MRFGRVSPADDCTHLGSYNKKGPLFNERPKYAPFTDHRPPPSPSSHHSSSRFQDNNRSSAEIVTTRFFPSDVYSPSHPLRCCFRKTVNTEPVPQLDTKTSPIEILLPFMVRSGVLATSSLFVHWFAVVHQVVFCVVHQFGGAIHCSDTLPPREVSVPQPVQQEKEDGVSVDQDVSLLEDPHSTTRQNPFVSAP